MKQVIKISAESLAKFRNEQSEFLAPAPDMVKEIWGKYYNCYRADNMLTEGDDEEFYETLLSDFDFINDGEKRIIMFFDNDIVELDYSADEYKIFPLVNTGENLRELYKFFEYEVTHFDEWDEENYFFDIESNERVISIKKYYKELLISKKNELNFLDDFQA